MANNYFQFEQFIIQQDQCAMKVTTDGCLFGAYVAERIIDYKLQITNCLDIGTGTGLLSLMLAQKINTNIDAVEIDEAAFNQAKENFNRSPWKDRLNIFNTDILRFNPDKKYDCIITNPPFFEDDLRSVDRNRNNAKHDTALTLKQLLAVVDKYLKEGGIFFVLLPYPRVNYFIEIAAGLDLHLSAQLNIRQTPTHNYFRSILSFTRKTCTAAITELTIKNTDNLYTAEFIDLLKDYYLHLV
jgi:tRNA1Val (adenine37-N6)-methyltransferase